MSMAGAGRPRYEVTGGESRQAGKHRVRSWAMLRGPEASGWPFPAAAGRLAAAGQGKREASERQDPFPWSGKMREREMDSQYRHTAPLTVDFDYRAAP